MKLIVEVDVTQSDTRTHLYKAYLTHTANEGLIDGGEKGNEIRSHFSGKTSQDYRKAVDQILEVEELISKVVDDYFSASNIAVAVYADKLTHKN